VVLASTTLEEFFGAVFDFEGIKLGLGMFTSTTSSLVA